MRAWVVGILASAILIAAIFTIADLRVLATGHAVGQALGNLSVKPCLAAFLLYAASYLGRAIRLFVLLPGSTSLLHLTSISARHNFLNLLLPLRTGEASLPLMLKAEAGRDLSEGTAALIVSRILDIISVGLWCLLGLSLVGDRAGSIPRILGVVGVGLLVLISLRPISTALSSRMNPSSRPGQFLSQSLTAVANLPAGRLSLAGLVSLPTWLLTYGACWQCLVAMGATPEIGPEVASIGFEKSLIGTTGLHLAGILPVNGFAGLGVWEAGWTAGYALVGMSELGAFTSAVVSHILIFSAIAILGGLGFLLRPRSTKTSGETG